MITDELSRLTTEQRNPRSVGIDAMTIKDALAVFHEEDRRAVEAVKAVAEDVATVIEWAVEAFGAGGRLIYVGAGTSGRLGVLDASECPPTFGVSPDLVVGVIAGGDAALRRSVEAAEDRPEDGAQAMRDHLVTSRDLIVGITASGRTPYALGALREAHATGAKTALLCCVAPNPELDAFVDRFIAPVVGPEIVAGSTRMKAGSATKLVLNQITTMAMIRLGKVYDNRMVDLRPMNEKLRQRAKRLVMEIAETDERAAQRALDAAGDVKSAVLMLRRNLDAATARQRLNDADGNLRAALQE